MRITLKSTIVTLVGVVIALTLAGCGATGPKFTAIEIPQKNESLVYVYRPSAFMGAAMSYDIHVKDKRWFR